MRTLCEIDLSQAPVLEVESLSLFNRRSKSLATVGIIAPTVVKPQIVFCRDHQENGSMCTHVVEMAPHLQLCRYLARDSDKKITYELSWPRTLFFFQVVNRMVSQAWAAVIKQEFKVKGQKTPLYILPMPNQHLAEEQGGQRRPRYLAQNMCIGHPPKRAMNARDQEYIMYLMDWTLNSTWNHELGMHISGWGVKSLGFWAQMTKKDPNYYTEIVYKPHQLVTVAALLQRVGTNY